MITSAALAVSMLVSPSDPAASPFVLRDVPYRTIDGHALALDVYRPPGEGPFSAVLTIHGGAWRMGSKAMDAPLATRLVKEGFAVFAVDYRLAPAAKNPAQIDDCVAALQFVRAHAREYRVDPKRIGAMGASAGAHLAALLATRDEGADPKSTDPSRRESTRLSCVAVWFGPMLLVKPRAERPRGPEQWVVDFMGASADAAAYRAVSPLTFVSPDDPPFLLVHGTKDDLVSIRQSEMFEAALRNANVPCELVRVEGGGHGDFILRDPDGEYWAKTVRFLKARLGPVPGDEVAVPAGR